MRGAREGEMQVMASISCIPVDFSELQNIGNHHFPLLFYCVELSIVGSGKYLVISGGRSSGEVG